ncbi:MAG: hypothetical protein EU547_03890 [Promethearchaeota archaeon]|nr:MAG: hypothetical protein EU547_03890 [Candidatus Lokiarchaeota archaeon]
MELPYSLPPQLKGGATIPYQQKLEASSMKIGAIQYFGKQHFERIILEPSLRILMKPTCFTFI